jgi:hypothetical protein
MTIKPILTLLCLCGTAFPEHTGHTNYEPGSPNGQRNAGRRQ